MIQKYVTKTVVIEAIKWDGGERTFQAIVEMANEGTREVKRLSNGDVVVSTLEGDMKADYGDYIIKGLKGELYPCKPDVFEMKYQLV